jgi:hypothetical protein
LLAALVFALYLCVSGVPVCRKIYTCINLITFRPVA